MEELPPSTNKKQRVAFIYLGLEATCFIGGLLDYNFLHKGDSLFIDYLGQLIAFFSLAGVGLCIYFLILRSDDIIKGKVFRRCLGLAVLGSIFPFLVLLYILSGLH